MNPFKKIVDVKEAAKRYAVTTQYLSRILKGRDPFPIELVDGEDYKLIGRAYLISESGLKKLTDGFNQIRNKK